MYPVRLVRLIEAHSQEIVNNLTKKMLASPRTRNMQKVGSAELHVGTMEILQHLSDWLLTKTDADIRLRYQQLGAHWAYQGIPLAEGCWALFLTKDHLWDFLQRQAFLCSPVEIYGEMELLVLLNQFFDRALCYAVEGYEQIERSEAKAERAQEQSQEANMAAWVP